MKNQLVRDDITKLSRECRGINLRQIPAALSSQVLQRRFDIAGMLFHVVHCLVRYIGVRLQIVDDLLDGLRCHDLLLDP